MHRLSLILACLLVGGRILLGGFRCVVGVDAPAEAATFSLCFGVGESALQEPLPPFSAMFGVKDCHLVDRSGGVRLRTDLRVGDAHIWLIQVNANLTLYFSHVEGLFYCSEAPMRDGSLRRASGPLPATLDCKANTRLAIATSALAAIPEFPASDVEQAVFVVQAEHYRQQRTLAVPASDALLAFAAGAARIVLFANGRYYCNDGTVSDTPPAACDWLVELDGDLYSYSASLAAITAPGGRLRCTLTALAPDAPPITVTSPDTRLHWLVKNFGTLDFDQNGAIDLNDVLYLYHFVQNGCPTPDDDWFTADMLAPLTEDTTPGQLQTALESLQDVDAALRFDGRPAPDLDNVLYFYNFVQNGLPGPEEDWFSAAQLAPLTENATPDRLQTALDTLRSLTW